MKTRDLGLAAAYLLIALGCNRGGGGRTFDQEFQLTLRAGRGELTDTEKSQLLRENHPILAQVGEPQMLPLMEMFARLPPELHAQLLEDSYLKWKFSDLPPDAQQTISEVIHFTIQSRFPALVRTGDQSALPSLSLSDVDVGFAVVELSQTKQKVVSWYAFGSQLPSPLWITIVNSPASTSEEYVQAHMQRLPLLRTMRPSSPPSLSQGRVTYFATDSRHIFCSTSG